ncbi:MAG TPA: NAD(P)H-hydrate dehydratase [Gallionella sp.]|nr:NAD(P)H-hydrate dehydratase [Gallionella sp.]
MNKPVAALGQKQVMANFPKRPHDSHKGLFGTVAVIGGANGMVGAALMAARAALRLGAGCVHVGLLAENAPAIDFIQPELMLHSASAALQLPDVNVYAVGCGLGTSVAAQMLLHQVLKRNAVVVLDADALNLLAKHADLQNDLRNRKLSAVLTPHPGEAARLLACSTKQIQSDRVAAARQLTQKYACSVVLKGANSLCATCDGKLFMNNTGNPGMSSAGMGDVLTGMIAALIAQGLSGDNAMQLAVHLHGAAGDALAEQHAGIGMTATEVSEWARYLLNKWLSN